MTQSRDGSGIDDESAGSVSAPLLGGSAATSSITEPDPAADISDVPTSRSSGLLFIAAVIAVLWTVILLTMIATKTTGLSQVAASLGGVVTVVAAGVGAFQKKLPVPKIRIERRVAIWLVVVVLLLDAAGTAGWAVWSYTQANADIDVTAQVKPQRQDNVLPGKNANFEIPVTAERDNMSVTFQVADHNPALGNCTPQTTLTLEPQTPGAPHEKLTTSTGTPETFALRASTKQVHLTVTVNNTRGDRNCAVDLFATNAALVND
jgi:hypothetical protein